MKQNTILLVEDDELDIISVQRSLSKLDIEYQLFTAFNGREAFEFLNDKTKAIVPTVILLDLNMPKMNGLEFLTILRTEKKFENIKVFVMTTSAEAGDRTKAEELGVTGFIIKPLSYNSNTKKLDSMDAFVQFHLRKILGGTENQ